MLALVSRAPLVIIVGPTGSGKSDLALHLAVKFSGEIVNCDSLQLYRYLDIGTAKVPAAERRGIPHHLIDILDPDQIFTAGEYSRAAKPILEAIAQRGKLPIIAGGTGFYLRALLNGLSPGPSRDEELRRRLLEKKDRLHRILRRIDPATAERIHPNDLNKTLRAVEVCLLSRRRMTAVFSTPGEKLEGFNLLKVGLNPDRALLVQRLNERCERMFADGIVDEVRRILQLGFPPDSKALESIGYAQALAYLQGRITHGEAITLTQAATRQYAKRQRTWFRAESGVHWISGFGHENETQHAAAGLVAENLFD